MGDDAPPGQIVTQSPGNFVFFWNLVVPMTLLMNVNRFGIRTHEIGLFLILWVNPHLLGYIVRHPMLAWFNTVIILVWVNRIMRRWAWFRIYTSSFLQSLSFLIAFICVPGLIMRYAWLPLFRKLPSVLERMTNCHNQDILRTYRSILLLCVGVGLLLHSLYVSTCYSDCVMHSFGLTKWICSWFKRKKRVRCICDSSNSSLVSENDCW